MADSPLAKFPPGVLELLSLKTNGQAPQLFGELVSPTFAIEDFYGASSVVSAQENFTGLTFPISQLGIASQFPRRVMGFSASITMGANVGTWISLACGMQLPGASVHMGEAFINVATAAGARIHVCARLPQQLVLPPGHQFYIVADSNATGNDHAVGIRYAWQRLDVSTP